MVLNQATKVISRNVLVAGLSKLDVACFGLLLLVGAGLAESNNAAISISLLAAGSAAALASPTSIVAGIVVTVPFVQHSVGIGGTAWMLLELAILLAAASVGVRFLLQLLQTRSLRPIAPLLTPISTSLAGALLIAIGVVSLLTVADPRYRPDSVRELRWVIIEPLIALLLFRWLIDTGRRRVLIGAFLVTGSIIAMISAAQLVFGSGAVVVDGVERAAWPYLHPNNLALYLERVAILGLGLALLMPAYRRLLVIATVTAGLGLALTLSRGAAAAIIVGAIWLVAAARVKHGWRWVAFGAVAVLAVFAIVAAGRLTDSGGSGTRSSRELIWESSVEMIRDHPVTGVGPDQFFNQYGRRYVQPAGWQERYTSHPHNIVLDFWLRLGLAGLAWLVAMCIFGVRFVVGSWGSFQTRAVRTAAVALIIAGGVHGLVDNGFFLPDLAVMTWMAVALMERGGRTSNGNARFHD